MSRETVQRFCENDMRQDKERKREGRISKIATCFRAFAATRICAIEASCSRLSGRKLSNRTSRKGALSRRQVLLPMRKPQDASSPTIRTRRPTTIAGHGASAKVIASTTTANRQEQRASQSSRRSTGTNSTASQWSSHAGSAESSWAVAALCGPMAERRRPVSGMPRRPPSFLPIN